MSNKILYSWKFKTKKNRWNLWYIIFISIWIWLIIWWFLNKIYGLSFVVMILWWLMYFIENNSPDEIEVIINELWIQVWSNFYDFWEINSFTMIYNWNIPEILKLNLNKKWLRRLDLYIDSNNASKIRNTLLNFIKENSKEQLNFSEKIINYLKL